MGLDEIKDFVKTVPCRFGIHKWGLARENVLNLSPEYINHVVCLRWCGTIKEPNEPR